MSRIKDLVNRVKKSLFLKNIATLATGTVIAQIIPILLAPVLSRIYLPEDYGLLGVFFSITSITGILAVLQLNQAVIVSESEEDRLQIIYTAIRVNIFVAFIVLLLIILSDNLIVSFFKSPELKYILYLAPLQIVFSGLSSLFMAFINKLKKYRKMSTVRVVIAVSITSTSLILGLSGFHKGLVYALVFGNFIGFLFLTKLFFEYRTKKPLFNQTVFKKILESYKRFPLFMTPTGFLGTLTNQLPVYILSRLANLSLVGSFNYSRRMLGLPSSFLSQSITEVFRQHASDAYQKKGNAKSEFLKTFKLLFFISIIPFSVILLWGPEIFTFVFGDKWTEAGEISRILTLMFFFRFTVSPLSYMYIISGHQREDLIMHVLIIIFTGGSMIFAYIMFNSFMTMLLSFSISYAIIYIIYFFRSYQFSQGVKKD